MAWFLTSRGWFWQGFGTLLGLFSMLFIARAVPARPHRFEKNRDGAAPSDTPSGLSFRRRAEKKRPLPAPCCTQFAMVPPPRNLFFRPFNGERVAPCHLLGILFGNRNVYTRPHLCHPTQTSLSHILIIRSGPSPRSSTATAFSPKTNDRSTESALSLHGANAWGRGPKTLCRLPFWSSGVSAIRPVPSASGALSVAPAS